MGHKPGLLDEVLFMTHLSNTIWGLMLIMMLWGKTPTQMNH